MQHTYRKNHRYQFGTFNIRGRIFQLIWTFETMLDPLSFTHTNVEAEKVITRGQLNLLGLWKEYSDVEPTGRYRSM